jgi:hypothetical protein
MIAHCLDAASQLWQFTIDYEEARTTPFDIVRLLGYPDGGAPKHIQEIVDEALNEAGSRCSIKGGIRFIDAFEINQDRRHLMIGQTRFAVGKIISAQVRHATTAAFFICTIGDGMEKWVQDLMRSGDYIKAYIVDMIASETVDAAMDRIQDWLGRQQELYGKHITNRYSPGYCGWHVSEQHKLFSFFPPSFCGITLTESSLMVPIKSISGIIGIGFKVKKVDYICKFCDMKDCIYRRKSEKPVPE